MSMIIDLNLVCGVCLQESEQLRSVFEQDDATDLSISEKIAKCCAGILNIKVDSKLPDKICSKCLQDLTVAYRFRQNCEASATVFRTIEQQEDVLANYELEQQKIKIPLGLKIKRIQPETKTYILPMQIGQVALKTPAEADSSSCEQNADREQESVVAKEADVEVFEETEVAESDEELDLGREDEEQLEEVVLDDYYEVEEMLEEQFEGEIVEIKVEKQDGNNKVKSLSTITTTDRYTTEDDLRPIIKSETDDEFITVENTPPTSQQQTSIKCRRGRPKKSLGSSSKGRIESDLKTESKDENEVDEGKSCVKLEISPKMPSSSVLKPISVAVVPSRKRKFLSPDSRPTKICDICGNSYKYQHALNAHMRRHNNDRPFNCEFCEKAFVSAVELRRHMRVHTGHKPYACQYCERRFSDFGSRIKHERTHTGERPYRCSTCGKSFAYAHVLSVHVRTHTGEKKFRCNICGKGFTKKVYLITHMENHARIVIQASDALARNQQDLMAINHEECIFTTEYIDAAEEENMSEEHLEENEEVEDEADLQINEHLRIVSMNVKQENKVEESDESNCETMA